MKIRGWFRWFADWRYLPRAVDEMARTLQTLAQEVVRLRAAALPLQPMTRVAVGCVEVRTYVVRLDDLTGRPSDADSVVALAAIEGPNFRTCESKTFLQSDYSYCNAWLDRTVRNLRGPDANEANETGGTN